MSVVSVDISFITQQGTYRNVLFIQNVIKYIHSVHLLDHYSPELTKVNLEIIKPVLASLDY